MWCWCSNVVISAAHVVLAASSLQSRRRHHRVGIQANMESSISGSDVLWALQKRASTRKIKIKIKKESSSSAPSRMEETPPHTDVIVRPLCINDHWGPKLDELEKRLRHLHLSEHTL